MAQQQITISAAPVSISVDSAPRRIVPPLTTAEVTTMIVNGMDLIDEEDDEEGWKKG